MLDYGLERSADVLARGFADYFVRIPFDLPMVLSLTRTDSVDLAQSRVAVRDGAAVGAALIARRGWTCRLAAMAILPEARRFGVGRAIVHQLLDEAKARRDRTMILEVIAQNVAAVELYRACGFETVRRLIGCSGPDVAAGVATRESAGDLTEVDLREVAYAVARCGLPDLPWQLSGETIAQLSPPAVGYRCGNAWIAITDPAQPVVAVRALVAEPATDSGVLTTLVRSVMTRYPAKTEWRFQPIWPEEFAPTLDSLGLPRTALTQWQMQRTIH